MQYFKARPKKIRELSVFSNICALSIQFHPRSVHPQNTHY
jgi:hypothetical protein